MAKFNVGDKVHWGKTLGTRISLQIMGVFTVESVNKRGEYTLTFRQGAHAYDVPEAELELAEDAAE